MLETEWVLRHAYGIDREAMNSGFRKLMGLPNVNGEDSQTVFQAVAWYEAGLGFADALHLASNMKVDAFATFDQAFIKKARTLIAMDIRRP